LWKPVTPTQHAYAVRSDATVSDRPTAVMCLHTAELVADRCSPWSSSDTLYADDCHQVYLTQHVRRRCPTGSLRVLQTSAPGRVRRESDAAADVARLKSAGGRGRQTDTTLWCLAHASPSRRPLATSVLLSTLNCHSRPMLRQSVIPVLTSNGHSSDRPVVRHL